MFRSNPSLISYRKPVLFISNVVKKTIFPLRKAQTTRSNIQKHKFKYLKV